MPIYINTIITTPDPRLKPYTRILTIYKVKMTLQCLFVDLDLETSALRLTCLIIINLEAFTLTLTFTLTSDVCDIAANCDSVDCGPNKRCVMRGGKPKCVCAPDCEETSGGRLGGPVCGLDGRSYRSNCSLARHNCRHNRDVRVDYPGRCQRKYNNSLLGIAVLRTSI